MVLMVGEVVGIQPMELSGPKHCGQLLVCVILEIELPCLRNGCHRMVLMALLS